MRHHILGDKGVEEGDEQMKDLTLGPPIDLRTAGDLSRYFRDDIIRSAQTRYAA